MKQITGGVNAAKGFQAASTAAGIKYKDRKDMAMIYSEVPCKAAGTFTTNIVKAAPVKCGIQQQSSTGGCHQCRNCQRLHRRGRHGLLQADS